MLQAIHDNKEHTLIFRDTLHASDVTVNLISISKLDAAGWHSVFGDR